MARSLMSVECSFHQSACALVCSQACSRAGQDTVLLPTYTTPHRDTLAGEAWQGRDESVVMIGWTLITINQ